MIALAPVYRAIDLSIEDGDRAADVEYLGPEEAAGFLSPFQALEGLFRTGQGHVLIHNQAIGTVIMQLGNYLEYEQEEKQFLEQEKQRLRQRRETRPDRRAAQHVSLLRENKLRVRAATVLVSHREKLIGRLARMLHGLVAGAVAQLEEEIE